MLHDANLSNKAPRIVTEHPHISVSQVRRYEVSVKRSTFPKAPLPTHLRRTKWKRLTSPSKSIGCERGQVGQYMDDYGGREDTCLRPAADGTHVDREFWVLRYTATNISRILWAEVFLVITKEGKIQEDGA